MKSERSVGIDCLRAISIIWVLLYHFVPLQVFNRGTFGVLLFFIISGYCIAFSVETSQSAWHFYAKRLGRLLPALIVCGLLTTLFKHVMPNLVEPGRGVSWFDYAYTLISLPTLNVLHVDHHLPDGAYWSLQIEFQFYLFCFATLALGLKQRLLALLCVVTIFRTLTTSSDFYTSNDFFPFFIAGMSVAALVRGRTREGIIGITVAFAVELYHLNFNVKQPSVAIEMYRSLLLWSGTAAVYLAARYDQCPASIASRLCRPPGLHWRHQLSALPASSGHREYDPAVGSHWPRLQIGPARSGRRAAGFPRRPGLAGLCTCRETRDQTVDGVARQPARVVSAMAAVSGGKPVSTRSAQR